MSKVTFNPTISFDGVAIIVGCISCCIWFGSISETIRTHTEMIRRHDIILQTLSDGQKQNAENMAVLTTLVNERTKKP